MANSKSSPMDRGDRVPIPDPTLLTTQALIREIAALKEVVFTRLDGMDEAIRIFNANITRVPTDTDKQIQHLKELHDEKFTASEDKFVERDTRASQTLSALTDSTIATHKAMDEKIAFLQALHDEKFKSIQVQFTERDVRSDQTSRDSKQAVQDALTAAKEAVGKQNESSSLAIAKSEAATSKQLDQLAVLIQTNTTALDKQINDLKERFLLGEGRISGTATAGATQQMSNALLVTIVVGAVGGIAGIGGLIIAISKLF